MAGALIEIDISKPWLPEARRPGGFLPRLWRALSLVALVVVVLTGPALLTAGSLSLAWRADVVSGFFWLTSDAAFTVDAKANADPRTLWLTARDPLSGTPRWSVELVGPLATAYARGREVMISHFPPTPNLGVTTRSIDSRTGQSLKAYPTASAALAYVGSDVAILIDRDPAAGPEPGPDDLSRDDTGLDRPHLITARDLRTGAVRWTKRLPAGYQWSLPGVRRGTEGIVGLPPGQDWMLVVSPTRSAQVWDLRTGAPIAQREFGSGNDPSYLTALADTVLVRVDTMHESSLAGYVAATLHPQWRFRPPDIYAAPFDCANLVCFDTERSVWVVDPRDGSVRWRADGVRLRPGLFSDRLLVTGYGEQLAQFDVTSGKRRAGNEGWRVVDPSAYGAQMAVAQTSGSGRATLGLLDVASATVRRLGQVSHLSTRSQCLTAAVLVACEDGNVLEVWRPR